MAYLMDPGSDSQDYWAQFDSPTTLQPQVQPGYSMNPTPTLPFVRTSPALPALPPGVSPGQTTSQPGQAPTYRPGLQGADRESFLRAFFQSKGVPETEVPYWLSKWDELEARGREIGNPNYLMDRLNAAEILGGGKGGYGGYAPGGFGSLNQLDTAQFGGIDSVNDPGYQFRLKEGLKAIEGSAFARGTGLSGGTLKALTNYATGAANQAYGDDWQRAYQQFMGNYGVRSGERNSLFNRNYSLANLGLNAANS